MLRQAMTSNAYQPGRESEIKVKCLEGPWWAGDPAAHPRTRRPQCQQTSTLKKSASLPDLLFDSVETGSPNFSVSSTSFQILARNSRCNFLNSWWVTTNPSIDHL